MISGVARAGRTAPPTLVAIGASAGGPAALAALLAALPQDLPAAVIIVQHLDLRFAAAMAEWLGQHSVLPVGLVTEGDRPAPGTVRLAATNDHLVMKNADRLGYRAEPRDCVYRPSIDAFFQSASELWPHRAIGILLTGMGADGVQGLKALRSKGHHTITQDQATSAVYGMPKAAAAADAASEILPLGRIAARLTEHLAHRRAGAAA
jgi:two-component system, chemotaxis family, response regulator WspF